MPFIGEQLQLVVSLVFVETFEHGHLLGNLEVPAVAGDGAEINLLDVEHRRRATNSMTVGAATVIRHELPPFGLSLCHGTRWYFGFWGMGPPFPEVGFSAMVSLPKEHCIEDVTKGMTCLVKTSAQHLLGMSTTEDIQPATGMYSVHGLLLSMSFHYYFNIE